jgi:hypothetical protein
VNDDIVGPAGWSAPTEEMCEIFSTGIDVKAFMLEIAASDGDTREGTSQVQGQSLAWRMRTWENRRGGGLSVSFGGT